MNQFVYSGARWSCPNGGHGTISNFNGVELASGGLLTTADKPVTDGTGICALHEGAPCTPTFSSWIGASPDVICGGHNALLDTSMIPCAGGGTAIIDSLITNVCTGFIGNVEYKEDDVIKNEPSPPNEPMDQADHTVSDLNDSASIQDSVFKEIEEPFSSPEILREKKWCMGRCPSDFQNHCRFCTASSKEMNHKNDSSVLRGNMKSFDEASFTVCEGHIRSIQYPVVNPRIQATAAKHHIIPGNACFKKSPLLIKLGNLFDYDINSGLNGILLPTFSNLSDWNDQKSELYAFTMKRASELLNEIHDNRVENIMGAQLHIGPHSFEKQLIRLNPDVQSDEIDYHQKMKLLIKMISKIHPQIKTFRSYEKIVIEDYLQPLELHYQKRYEHTCYMRDFEREKNGFHDKMNQISSEVRHKIKQFPRQGAAFGMLNHQAYVSFAALLYDLDIPVEEWEQFMK